MEEDWKKVASYPTLLNVVPFFLTGSVAVLSGSATIFL
jgi:hypothetical protein